MSSVKSAKITRLKNVVLAIHYLHSIFRKEIHSFISAVSCGDPPNIPNGSRTFTGTTIGETATYTCDDGYHPVQPATVTCQATGSWDPVPFICRKILSHTIFNYFQG